MYIVCALGSRSRAGGRKLVVENLSHPLDTRPIVLGKVFKLAIFTHFYLDLDSRYLVGVLTLRRARRFVAGDARWRCDSFHDSGDSYGRCG